MVEDFDGLALEHGFREQEERHIRPAPGAIDGKEAQPGRGYAEQMAVSMRHQLIALLGSRVEGDGVVHIISRGQRHFLIQSVHAGAGGVGQVPDLVVAAALQYIGESDDIAIDIRLRVDEAVAHARLCGQVDYGIKLFGFEELVEPFAVHEVQLDELVIVVGGAFYGLAVGYSIGIDSGVFESVVFDLWVVVVVDDVEAGDLVAAGGEAVG